MRVFARCSPQGKAKVIRSLQRNDAENHVLMCGDGGNDVGALKQADVGLALLSGYGNANTTDVDGAAAQQQPAAGAVVPAGTAGAAAGRSAEEQLNAQSKELTKRSAEALRLRKVAGGGVGRGVQ